MKLVIVENEPFLRECLCTRLQKFPGLEVIGQAGDGDEAVACIRRLKPEVVLLDLELPEANGFEVIATIRPELPHVRFVIFTGYCTPWTTSVASKFKVAGFIDKVESGDDILREAMQRIAGGGTYFSAYFRNVTGGLYCEAKALDRVLSDWEQQMLAWFAEAQTNDEIAAHTGLAVSTIKDHRHNIMLKLGLQSTPKMMKYAQDLGFTQLRVLRRKLSSASPDKGMARGSEACA